MQVCRLFHTYSRLVLPLPHNVLKLVSAKTHCEELFKISPSSVYHRSMSQKSIKSFFKITPKKSEANEKAEGAGLDSLQSSPEESKPSNGTAKRSKRLRSISSDEKSSESVAELPIPKTSEKKQVKRQRIESSDSETETITREHEEAKTEIKKEKSVSPKETPVKDKKRKDRNKEEELKTEKDIKAEKPSPETPKGAKKKEAKKKKPTPKNTLFLKKESLEKESTSNGVNKENVKKEEDSVKGEKVAEVDYDPSKLKYHPIKDSCWVKDQEVPYLALARTLELIESTSARLKMVEILSNYFRSVIALTPEDLLPSIYLCLNQLAPAYHNLELGIAETYLMKAVGTCTGRTVAQVRSAAQRCGDLGRAAEACRATQRVMFPAPPLNVRKVYRALREIAACTGQASVNKKISKIQTLYVACRHSEARYLIRSLEGKLRVGLAEQSLLQALALACAKTPPAGDGAGVLDVSTTLNPEEFKARVEKYAITIKTTYCECPNYDMIVPVLLQHGVLALPDHCRLTPGVPLKPMLAHPARGVSELFDRFEGEEFTCEWKYDGERAQIHVPGDETPRLEEAAIFSRNQENNTTKYPDILKRLPSLLKASVGSCVLDCEAVAYDVAAKQILPFQILSTRKRKDAAEDEIKVQVCVFVFDLLYLNGRALVREPLLERRRLLREHFAEVEGEWQFATSQDCKEAEEVETLLAESVRGSCEGLMVKALKGPKSVYDIARRSRNWLKLKKDYLEGVGDTVDAVVLGGYRGKGKRAGAYGGFLLACYDAEAEQYQSLCKIGTGFSDDDLKTLSGALDQLLIDAPKNYYRFDSAHAPDAWFAAGAVWEVRCADLSLSPAHRAAIGLVDPDKGISLRFPRFVRVREDKTAEQATSAQQIAELYLAQDQVRNSAKHTDCDDFY